MGVVFFIYFSITVLVGIWSKNSIVALIVTFALLLFIGYLLEIFHVRFPSLVEGTLWDPIVAGAYWLFPKVETIRDIHDVVLQYNMIPIPQLPELLSSLAFAVVLYGLAWWMFIRHEY
jgi:hypothetical protein